MQQQRHRSLIFFAVAAALAVLFVVAVQADDDEGYGYVGEPVHAVAQAKGRNGPGKAFLSFNNTNIVGDHAKRGTVPFTNRSDRFIFFLILFDQSSSFRDMVFLALTRCVCALPAAYSLSVNPTSGASGATFTATYTADDGTPHRFIAFALCRLCFLSLFVFVVVLMRALALSLSLCMRSVEHVDRYLSQRLVFDERLRVRDGPQRLGEPQHQRSRRRHLQRLPRHLDRLHQGQRHLHRDRQLDHHRIYHRQHHRHHAVG
jgi:hypothetical protein